MPARKAAPPKRSAEADLRSFIAKFDPANRALIRGLRTAMRARLPTANELVWDNYNFLVIAYGPSERPSHALLSLAFDAHGANLHFLHGVGLPDPKKILLGSGSQNRFVRLPSVTALMHRDVQSILAAAIGRLAVPLPPTGRGTLTIRAVSPKQRPRRTTA